MGIYSVRLNYFDQFTSNMKEALQNVRYLNNDVTHPGNIEHPTKTLKGTEMVQNDTKNRGICKRSNF